MCKIIDLNDLTGVCGYSESKTGVNNFYGCKHPDCKESEEYEPGKSMGKCYSFSCPLASEADLKDLKKWNNELYEDWKDEGDPSEMGGELMLVCDNELLGKL